MACGQKSYKNPEENLRKISYLTIGLFDHWTIGYAFFTFLHPSPPFFTSHLQPRQSQSPYAVMPGPGGNAGSV